MKNTIKKSNNKNIRKCVGVNAQWIALFNDIASKTAGRDWTDAEISERMHRAFPARKSAVFNQVSLVRGRFNRGALNGQVSAPRRKAFKVVAA